MSGCSGMIRQGNIQLRSVFGAGPEDQQQWFVSGDREPVGDLAGSDGESQRGTETFRAALIIFEADESYPRRLVEDNLPAAFFSQRHFSVGVTRRLPVRCHAFPLWEGTSPSLRSSAFALLPSSLDLLLLTLSLVIKLREK